MQKQLYTSWKNSWKASNDEDLEPLEKLLNIIKVYSKPFKELAEDMS